MKRLLLLAAFAAGCGPAATPPVAQSPVTPAPSSVPAAGAVSPAPDGAGPPAADQAKLRAELAAAGISVISYEATITAPALTDGGDLKPGLAGSLAGLDGVTHVSALDLPAFGEGAGRAVASIPGLTHVQLLRTKATPGAIAAFGGCPTLEVLELNIGTGPDPVVTDAALAGLSKLKRVTHLMIQNGTVTGRGLAAVAGFDRLEVLQLSGNPVDDAAVQTLGQLTALKELELTRTTIAAPKLAAGLKGLRGLRELNLSFSELTDADVPSLAGLSQLRRLSLSGAKLTDAAAPPLAAMPELRMLDLAATEVTDAGAKALGAAKSLTHLDLSHSKVTDTGVAAVAKLPGLKVLGVSGLPLTDKSLEALAGVPSLLAVRVDSKAITEGGLAKFKAAKPNVVLSKW